MNCIRSARLICSLPAHDSIMPSEAFLPKPLKTVFLSLKDQGSLKNLKFGGIVDESKTYRLIPFMSSLTARHFFQFRTRGEAQHFMLMLPSYHAVKLKKEIEMASKTGTGRGQSLRERW